MDRVSIEMAVGCVSWGKGKTGVSLSISYDSGWFMEERYGDSCRHPILHLRFKFAFLYKILKIEEEEKKKEE